MAFAHLGDKFPQELKKARDLDALGIEIKNTQNPCKTRDKSSETESTVSQPPREGDTNMPNENTNTESNKRFQDPSDRVADAIYEAVNRGIRVEQGFTIDSTSLQGAAVGAAIGSMAAGFSVGFGMKTSTPSLVLGSTVAGGAGGALFGAAIAKTIWK